MKWLAYIAAVLLSLLLLGVCGLWLARFRSGAGKNEARVEIARPVAHVWRFLTDDALVLKWVGGLKVVEPEPGVPEGVGWRARMTVELEGKRHTIRWVTTAFEPQRLIGFTVSLPQDAGMGFDETGEYRLEERDGRTVLTLSTHSQYQGWFTQLIEPVITASAQNKLQGDLTRLKALAESEPVQTQP